MERSQHQSLIHRRYVEEFAPISIDRWSHRTVQNQCVNDQKIIPDQSPWIESRLIAADTLRGYVYHAPPLRHIEHNMRHLCDIRGASGSSRKYIWRALIISDLSTERNRSEYSNLVTPRSTRICASASALDHHIRPCSYRRGIRSGYQADQRASPYQARGGSCGASRSMAGGGHAAGLEGLPQQE